jgi:hypothetical protein
MVCVGCLAAAGLLTGCHTYPPGAERGPHGTMAYYVSVEASSPGAKIEANGEYVGETPVTIKIFGNTDGTFHDFGSYFYALRAYPLTTNQFVQTRWFRTGHDYTFKDMVPKRIYFDMNQNAPSYPPYVEYRGYGPYYGYPWYGPYWYYGPWWYGPRVRVFVSPHRHR